MPIFNEYSLGNVGKFEITLKRLKGTLEPAVKSGTEAAACSLEHRDCRTGPCEALYPALSTARNKN